MFVSPHPALRQFEMFFLISWAFSQGDRNQVVFARPFTLFKEVTLASSLVANNVIQT